MDIQESVRRNPQQRSGKDFPVGDDHSHVRPDLSDLIDDLANFLRLRQPKAELVSLAGDRRRLQPQPAAGAFIRLRDDERNFMLARQRLERRNGEFGSAEENQAQSVWIVVS